MNKNTWRKKTEARIVTIPRLKELIRERSGVAVGLAGFSGSFKKNEREDAEEVTRQVLQSLIAARIRDSSGAPIFFISGATNLGVPEVGYAVAEKLGCTLVGVTAEAAIRYSIANLDYLTVIGKKFGDESNGFISAIDELWVIGGGQQSLKEAKLALEASVPVTIIQGIGGIADDLSADSFDAVYLNVDQYLTDNDS